MKWTAAAAAPRARRALFDSKVDPKIQAHLAMAPEAAVKLQATQVGGTVKAKATVSNVKSKSDKLRVQIVLAEEMVTYSGENGERFHPMVVRGMAVDAKAAQGFALAPGKGGSFEYTFDLAKLVADAKESLTTFESQGAERRVQVPREEARDQERARGGGVRPGRGHQEGAAGDVLQDRAAEGCQVEPAGRSSQRQEGPGNRRFPGPTSSRLLPAAASATARRRRGAPLSVLLALAVQLDDVGSRLRVAKQPPAEEVGAHRRHPRARSPIAVPPRTR